MMNLSVYIYIYIDVHIYLYISLLLMYVSHRVLFCCGHPIFAQITRCSSWVGPGISVALAQQIGEGNGNPLQCSCLENPRDGGA